MIDFEKALLDPASMFGSPAEVVGRQDLSRDQKIETLRRWEYDARELQVAEEENMPPAESRVPLDAVLNALRDLNAGSERSAPTKQGGR